MSNPKINELISLAMITSPMTMNAILPEKSAILSREPTSLRSSMRRMQYLLVAPPQIPDTAIAQYPCFGVLKENADGFVYLDVDDDFIHELVHFIEPDGFVEPPYFGKTELVGAHISVMYVGEERMGNIAECGQVFSFTPLECKIVQPPRWDGVESAFLIEVSSPELDQLREKYGLEKYEFGFHITVGIKPKILN